MHEEIEGIDTIDTGRLAEYLQERIEGFPASITATKFEGGQSNPTFVLSDVKGASTSTKYVLRKQPPGKLLNRHMLLIANIE